MAQPEYTTYAEVVAWWRANPDATIHECKKALRVSPEKATEARREALAARAESPVTVPPTPAEGYDTTPAFSRDDSYSTGGTAPASGPARAPDCGGNGTLTRALEGETSRVGIGLELPASPREVVSEYPTIRDGVLVISDLHVPIHSKAWLERVVAHAVGQNVRRLLIAGDLLDGTNMGKHPSNAGEVFEQELELARQVVAWLRQYFSEITVFAGNHDAWFARRIDGQISTAKLLEWVCGDGVRVIRFHEHCYVGERWLVSHPGTYSRMPSKPAYDLCAIFHRNVAVAHTHKVAMARDVSGKYWALEMGMMGDPSRVGYVHQTLRTFPRHQQGALIIHEGGRPELLHPDLI
jgi:predicted phosphodiesterase